MMVITVKIILGIAPKGPVVEVHEAEFENHGTIIIQMIKAKILKGKTLNKKPDGFMQSCSCFCFVV